MIRNDGREESTREKLPSSAEEGKAEAIASAGVVLVKKSNSRKIHNVDSLKSRRKGLRSTLTPAEAALWKCLQRSQLGKKFRRQHSIGPFIVDFYCAGVFSIPNPQRPILHRPSGGCSGLSSPPAPKMPPINLPMPPRTLPTPLTPSLTASEILNPWSGQ